MPDLELQTRKQEADVANLESTLDPENDFAITF